MARYKSRSGGWLTRSLFYEVANSSGDWDKYNKEKRDAAIFSFKGREGFIDIRATFVELNDPTGYQWAVKYLDSWEHFNVLMQAEWFRVEFEKWLEELESKLKSQAVQRLVEIANGESSQSVNASKYLATLDYKKGARGRPSKNELQGELKRQAALVEEQESDAERIGLKVVK